MKRFIAILLLAGFLGSTTEFHELFKIPHLIVHYFTHKSEQNDIGLVEFIHIHYSHDHDNHKDDHHDRGCLPFQGEHNCHIQTMQFCSYSKVDFNLIPPVRDARKIFPDSEFSPSEFLSNIWQPPKV